jgi:6-phosphogluconolactonase
MKATDAGQAHTKHSDFADGQELAEALADRVAAALTLAIGERGTATLAVSGGNTPKRSSQRCRNSRLPGTR